MISFLLKLAAVVMMVFTLIASLADPSTFAGESWVVWLASGLLAWSFWILSGAWLDAKWNELVKQPPA
jgi:ABC-type polysaccharide/polyol phosphate export permease